MAGGGDGEARSVASGAKDPAETQEHDGRAAVAWAVQYLVMSTDRELVQRAFNAAVSGDLGPLVALFDTDLEWHGITRGHLWWRRTPS